MNLIEQIKQKAQQAKKSISNFINPPEPMRFPVDKTSEGMSKILDSAKRERESGLYDKIDSQSSLFDNTLAAKLKNKVGMNYEDAQGEAWRKGLEMKNPQMAAVMGNNPAFTDVDITGGLQSVGKKVGQKVATATKPVVKNIFQGFKDLSTKLVEDLKGKSVVNKSFIEQRLVSSDLNLKQVEKDLILSKLKNYPDRIDVNDFAENIKTDLLPLTPKKLTGSNLKYEQISLPQELRGNVQNYSEHIYESPIKTSAGGVHWNNIGGGRTADEIASNKANNKIENYFGHTRIEDIADSSLDKALHKTGGTRRVIEVQSDLYQKGRLENERIGETRLNALTGEKTKKLAESSRQKEVDKLAQYNDPTAHFRMVREEVKQAAIDGKTKLQFPTGETAMKIEGLGQKTENFGLKTEKGYIELIPDNLSVGSEIMSKRNTNEKWIITDVLEGEKFKAVPKLTYDRIQKSEGVILLSPHKETFDISGKVDTNNPIYKFYEKDLGKYLKSKFNAKEITDAQGVKWYELDIKPEFKDKPVEAFGFSTIENMLKTGGVIGGGLALGTGVAKLNNYAQKKLNERKLNKQEENVDVVDNNVDENTFLEVPKEKVIKTLINAESFGGDEEAFKNYIKVKAPWRLELEDSPNKYGDYGKFGWVVGFTIPTMESIIKGAKREASDKRENIGRPNSELLAKLNFDTKENAIKSALEYWKFKNQYYDTNSFPVGTKYDDIEEAYVNIYNASDIENGDREQARKNWQKHFVN